jgi:hypothetical protein
MHVQCVGFKGGGGSLQTKPAAMIKRSFALVVCGVSNSLTRFQIMSIKIMKYPSIPPNIYHLVRLLAPEASVYSDYSSSHQKGSAALQHPDPCLC